MDIGLYNAKYGFRKMISWVLPFVRNISPNVVSWSVVPVGAATATVYYFAAASGPSWLYLVGIALIFLRMFLGTLDGFMATEFGKATRRGAAVNRVAPELADVMYMVALPLASPSLYLAGIGALAMAWLVMFSGMLGAVYGDVSQSVGPVGQVDRLAALMLFSLLAFLGSIFGWRISFMWWFLAWVIVGSIPTVALRLTRALRRLSRAA